MIMRIATAIEEMFCLPIYVFAKHVKVPWGADCPALDSKTWGIDENLHLFESIHLLRSVDFDMCNIFRRKSDIEEFLLVCFGVGHDFVPSSPLVPCSFGFLDSRVSQVAC